MKVHVFLAASLLAFTTTAQNSEDLVPKDAVSVFSINNVNLLQKISMDELVKYDFMEELQQELFDGSTEGRTLKDSGVDFDQRVNVFQGQNREFKISGVSFGVNNREQLFEVFDDYTPIESSYPGVDFYSSYFNKIAIRGNSAILFRINPHMRLVNEITDSIWYARGNDYPWYDFEDFYYEDVEEEYDYDEDVEYDEENYNEPPITEEEPYYEEENDMELPNELPFADDDPTEKNYYELRDSVEASLLDIYFYQVCDELFVENKNLKKADKHFADQLTHISEGIFYLDNYRNYLKKYDFDDYYYPSYYRNPFLLSMDELYEENVLLGDLYLKENKVDVQLNMHYNEKLGSIYSDMTDAKFDKNVLKYIHKDNSAFFTYNVDMRKAYETTLDVIAPMMEKAGDRYLSSLMVLELYDEFLNKDAIFGVYQGSMFGSYSGIQKVKTKKIVFDYDEDTFEYIEREVEAEEDMPIFTLGFTTQRNDFSEKILKRIEPLFKELHPENGYWQIDNAVLNAAPLFFILKNDLFIITNDETLATKYNEGYGNLALSKKQAKKAKKSGVMYGHVDLNKAIASVPRDLFNEQENEMIDVLRGKSGEVEIVSSETTKESTEMKISYSFDATTDNSGKYILDLINSFYVITK